MFKLSAKPARRQFALTPVSPTPVLNRQRLPRLPDAKLEAEKNKVMAGLESAKESDNVVALHLRRSTRYKRAVTTLADELKCGNPTEFATIRGLVAAIIVHASPSRLGSAGSKANAEDGSRDRHLRSIDDARHTTSGPPKPLRTQRSPMRWARLAARLRVILQPFYRTRT